MYVCMYVCMYVRMYVCICVCMYLIKNFYGMCMCMYLCMYASSVNNGKKYSVIGIIIISSSHANYHSRARYR